MCIGLVELVVPKPVPAGEIGSEPLQRTCGFVGVLRSCSWYGNGSGGDNDNGGRWVGVGVRGVREVV